MASKPSRAKRSVSAKAAQGLSVRLRRSARWALVSGAAATGTLSWLKGGSSCVETKRPGTGPGLLGTRMARAALVGEDLGTGLTSKRLTAHAPHGVADSTYLHRNSQEVMRASRRAFAPRIYSAGAQQLATRG